MFASRAVKWGVAAVLVVAVSAFVYSGVVAAQAPSDSHPGPSGPTYNVTFNETGLAAGTNWSVAVFGHAGWGHPFRGHEKTSSGSSITFSLPNGTYRYRVHNVPGYLLSSGSRGVLNVTGASPATINVTFSKLATYTVTFQESGLPTGTNWTVAVAPAWAHHPGCERRSLVETGSSSTLTFSLLNGSYRYFVPPVEGFAIADNGSHGGFNVSGASPATIDVAFVPLVTYAVTFNETGLPSGTNWSVSVASWSPWGCGPAAVLTGTSNGTTITLELANGTYGFLVGQVPGYAVQGGPFGVVTVSGASPPVVNVTFVAFTAGGWPPPIPLSVG